MQPLLERGPLIVQNGPMIDEERLFERVLAIVHSRDKEKLFEREPPSPRITDKAKATLLKGGAQNRPGTSKRKFSKEEKTTIEQQRIRGGKMQTSQKRNPKMKKKKKKKKKNSKS